MCALGRDRRHRRREPDAVTSATRSTREGLQQASLRLHGHRRRRARALQPVRRRAGRVPHRRAPERGLHAPGRRLPVRARRRDAGTDPVLRCSAASCSCSIGSASSGGFATTTRQGRLHEQQHRRRRARLGRRLRHTAPVRGARRAARRALGRAQPRRRGDDARRCRDGVLRRAADRRTGGSRAAAGDRRRGARGGGGGADPRVPRDHASREPDRLGARADDLLPGRPGCRPTSPTTSTWRTIRRGTRSSP